MRIKMIKPVPGYPYPGEVSTSPDRAFNLVMNDCAIAIDAPQSFTDRVDSERLRISAEKATEATGLSKSIGKKTKKTRTKKI